MPGFEAVEALVPCRREKVEGLEYLAFRMDRDERGYYSWEIVERDFPKVLRCESRVYGRTGWNSDSGTVHYRELYPNEVCIPA